MAIKERKLNAFGELMDKLQQREDEVASRAKDSLADAREWIRSMRNE